MAVSNCTISSGIGIVCADLRRTGGLAKRVWFGNITDLRAPFNVDLADYIQTIELNTYATLYAYDGAKFAHSAVADLVKTDAGNVSFTHSLTMNLVNNNPTEDATLETLSTADVFAIVQTMNNEFFIYGAGNGLSASAISAPTGKNAGDTSATTITLTGSERTLPKRFLVGGTVQLTLARLAAQTSAV